jgi:hypothetical protein
MGDLHGENSIDLGDQYDEPVIRESSDAESPRTWQVADLAPILDGSRKRIAPTIGARTDGVGMFYPGRCHTIASESEAGKSWLALHAAVLELDRGNHVIYIDFEDEPETAVGRLLTLQLRAEIILSRFHYIRPVSPLGAGIHRDDLAQILGDTRPTLVVIDGVTEGMVLHGLDPLSNKDCATFGRLLPTAIARSGPGVVSLDHVTKSPDGRGRYAIGAVHKLNGLNGAAYLLDNRKAFGIGIRGISTVKIAKDRPGQIRRHCLPGANKLHWYGDLVLESHAEEYAELDVFAPVDRTGSASTFRPTHVMQKVYATVTEHQGISGRQLQALLGGKAAVNRQAIALLEIEGYITPTPHKTIKPFLVPEDEP